MDLSPEWLALEKQWGFRPKLNGTVDEIRAGYDNLSETLRAQEPNGPHLPIDVCDETIYGGLTVRVFTPKEVQEGKTVPIGVYARGGGYTVGSLDTSFEDRLCRYIAHHAPCILVSVGYRRAPEYPVPTQLYDYLGGFNWAWENAQKLGGSRDNMLAIGASCGGGMALAVALKYMEYGMGDRVKGVIALAPMTIHPEYVPERYKPHLKAWEENRDGPVVDFEGMMLFQGLNGATAQKHNQDVFVALHEKLGQLPPTYIATCGADVIRDDGTIIKVSLDEAQVPCKLDNYEGLPHFFWIYSEISEGHRFRENAAAAVNWVLSQRGASPNTSKKDDELQSS